MLELVNRAERMRNRALHVEARNGRYENYWTLVRLSFQPIQDTSGWERIP